MNPVFEAKQISKRFGGVLAVNDFSAVVNEGEIVGIIGPNGAGKTTIINLVSGIYKLDSGSIFLNGEDISNMEKWKIAKRGVGRTFQNIRLFDTLTALENIMTVIEENEKLSEKDARKSAIDLMSKFGWTDDPECAVRDLPYGKKRRLELIRALALEPKFLMLDEPAAGLNPSEIQELISYVSVINREYKIPIILIEHRLEMIMKLCDRVYVVNFGQTIAHGTPKEIWADPVVIAAYLGEEA